MPRRKGYGIPPTKRIKLDSEVENDENEANDTSCESSSTEAPKTESDDHAKKSECNGSTSCPNGASVNGIKYLHKKFKKMAAILPDDLTLPGDLPTSSAATRMPEVKSEDDDKSSVSMSPIPLPACSPCSPVALPSPLPKIMTAAVATISVVAALPSDDKASRYACTYCKLVCNKPSVLQKHLRAHTGERPYPCLPCGFAFKTRSNLYKHCRSRSHSLKLEEVSGGAGGSSKSCNTNGSNMNGNVSESDSKASVPQDDEVDDDDDTQTNVVIKDEDSTSGEERIEQPRKFIYKPKFHKYIQNSGTTAPATTVKNEQVVTPTNPLNKLGLQLKISTTSTLPVSSRSMPSTLSSLSAGSSPSPEFLKRHISKLISENQAIVDTIDPFWSRRFYQRSKENMSPSSPLPTSSSSSSSPSPTLEQVKKMKASLPSQSVEPVIEEKLPLIESKLASALIHPRPVVHSVSMSDLSSNSLGGSSSSSTSGGVVASSAEESQPLNLTMNKTAKFVRPTSLPLQPGTFVPKKLIPGAVAVLPLISPETPRPNKSYGQLYIGGNAYTYLGLKCSTRSTFCTLYKSQPTYVPLSPEHNKVSMYSNWMVRSEVDPFLRNVACYDSRQRYSRYTVVHGKMKDAVTHSSYWFNRAKFNDANGGIEDDGDSSMKNKTQSIDKVISNEEEENDEEETEDYGANDATCQLEREVARSLLSLSKISHQTVSEQYANAGLVPLNARPNTYPYNYSAVMSSKPHTHATTPLFISEQKERETVSKNTGLARELQSDSKSEQMKQKFDTPAQSGDRYYFGSSSEVKAMKLTSDLEESVHKDSVTVTSVFPIDLSSKHAVAERKTMIVGGGVNTVPDSAASISEILTPVSEPVLLATICSSVDRLSAVTGGAGQLSATSPVANVADTTEGPSTLMLHTYLKERAVQDLKIKQQYQSSHIKTEQRDFDVKFNAYNEAFQKGATAPVAAANVATTTVHPVPADKLDDVEMVRTTPSLKRKNYFVCENNEGAEKAFVMMQNSNNNKTKIDRVKDSDSKENFALSSVDQTEKSDCSTNSVIILVGGANASANNASKKLKAEFISPCSGSLPKYASVSEDGRSKCVVCNKVFSKPSQLRLHVNIHYFEQPFRCEPCAVSFRTKGHLHKHLGSNSHLNKMTMNSSGNGQTSVNNPRPFKCDDCGVGFRIRGYLAKHLRSKMHIMKLECVGKLPFGTYTEMERCGINMNEIDTTNCENSLESLHRIAKGIVGSEFYGNNMDEETHKIITDSPAS